MYYGEDEDRGDSHDGLDICMHCCWESEEELVCDVPDCGEEIQGKEPVDCIIEYEDTHHYVPPVIPSFVESLLLCGWYFPVHDSL